MIPDPVEELIQAVVGAPASFARLLQEWQTYDRDLQSHYAGEARWLLGAVDDLLDEAAVRDRVDGVFCKANSRLAQLYSAAKKLAAKADEFQATMGFRPEAMLAPNDVAAAMTGPIAPPTGTSTSSDTSSVTCGVPVSSVFVAGGDQLAA